ncbi:hypothetical protein PLESTM_000552800 [Pleodorina starrii]|nr:hypothetical protein PLESTM_000552800 [Pleodorina starrii]
MSLFGDDPEREQFFEIAKQQAQREFESDNTNVQALVRWGGALLELAHFKQGDESADTIKEAITKLQQAISLDSDRTDAYWCLGNAYTSLGFLCPDKSKANQNFKEASKAFKHCYEKEPSNETYKKALEMCEKVGWVGGTSREVERSGRLRASERVYGFQCRDDKKKGQIALDARRKTAAD